MGRPAMVRSIRSAAVVAALFTAGCGGSAPTSAAPDVTAGQPRFAADDLCALAAEARTAEDEFRIGPSGALEGSPTRYLALLTEMSTIASAPIDADLVEVAGFVALSLGIHDGIDLAGEDAEVAALFAAIAAREEAYPDPEPAFARVEKSFAHDCDVDLGLSGNSGADPRLWESDVDLVALADGCRAGDPVACDDLYFSSPLGSTFEALAFTCGEGRFEPAYGTCATWEQEQAAETVTDTPSARPEPSTPGDDEVFDRLLDACTAEVFDACDDLADASSRFSDYYEVAASCGGRLDHALFGECTDEFGSDDGLDGTSQEVGDDPGNDILHAACADGLLRGCDLLFFNSAPGSTLEAFGSSCGERRTTGFADDCF